MSSQDPGIGTKVVAEQRLTPVMRGAQRSPERRFGFVDRAGILGQDFRNIVGSVAVPASLALVVPQEVKHPHESVRPRRSDLIRKGQLTSQRIRRRPGYAGIAHGGRR